MRVGSYELKLQSRVTLSGWQAALISIFAIIVALAIFSLIFIQAGVNPLTAYKEIFSYAFFNLFGLPLTINRFIFLLLCSYAFIIPFRAGLWNIGMTGQLYIGSLFAFAVLLFFNGKNSQLTGGSPALIILLMVLAAALGGAAIAAIAGFFRGRYNINEIVVTMILNFIAFWLVSFMIKEGGPFMNPGGRGESFELPDAVKAPLFNEVPFTIFLALGLAERFFGNEGLSQAIIISALLIPFTNIVSVTTLVVLNQKQGGGQVFKAILKDLGRNPLLLGVVAGILVNLLGISPLPILDDTASLLGTAALPMMLVGVGANIRLDRMRAKTIPTLAAIFGKMVVFPLAGYAAILFLDLSGMPAALLLLYGAVPTASSSSSLARQMGGDAPLMAAIITIQTAISFFTIPLTLLFAQNLIP